MPDPDLKLISEAAREAQVPRKFIHAAIDAGLVRVIQIPGVRTRVSLTDVIRAATPGYVRDEHLVLA